MSTRDGASIDEAELAEMEARCVAASPGPWHSHIVGRDLEAGLNCIELGSCELLEVLGAKTADQDFIASARSDVPRLIADIRRLNWLIGSLKSELLAVGESATSTVPSFPSTSSSDSSVAAS